MGFRKTLHEGAFPVEEASRGSEHCNLRPPEAARYLGLSPSTLAKWRCTGEGVPYIKLGRAVVYRLRDLEAFVAAQGTRRSTSDRTAA